MEVQTSYLVPKQALGPLYEARQRGAAGCSGGFSWVQADGQLHFWRYREGSEARMRSLRLPRAVSDPSNSAARLFIAILQQPRSNAITVVACSSSGTLAAWMDANHMAEPITTQVAAAGGATTTITSFAATAPESSGSGPVFVAAAGAPDGSWMAVQGSAQGLFTRQINRARMQQQEAKGMLGKIGSVISWGYTEAFDPSAKMIKKSPSGRPVVDLHVAALDASRLRVMVLTDVCVECWLVSLGLRPSEQLLWSFQNLLAIRQASVNLRTETAKPGPGSTNLALGMGASHLYVWLQDVTQDGFARHFMQRLLVDESGQPVHDWFTHMQAMDSVPVAPANAPPGHTAHQLACDPSGQACLCLLEGVLLQCSSEGGHLEVEPKAGAYALNISPGFLAPEPRVQQLGTDIDAVAIAPCDLHGASASALGVATANLGGLSAAPGTAPNAALWVLLSTTYGVLELAKHQEAPAQGLAEPPGPLTAEQSRQVFQLLDTSVNQALLAQQQQQQQQQLMLNSGAVLPPQGAARPLLALVASLGRRLEALGALKPTSNMAVLTSYSTQLTDLLPKQWTEGSLTSSPGASFSEQLSEKASRHAALLDCLAESAVLYRLDPEVQRPLLENAEKLAVAMGILSLQASVQAGAAQGQQGPEAELLLQVLHRAGQISSAGGAGSASAVLQPLELFYAQPSLSTPALLQALAEAAQQVARNAEAGLTRPSDQGATVLRSQVALLAEVLGTAVAACSSRQAQLTQLYKLSPAAVAARLGLPGWLEGGEARGHVETMLLACQSLHTQLGQGPGSSAIVRSLFGITEVLLTAWAAAVAAAPAGGSRSAALAEYRAARGRHVPLLLREALQELQPGRQQQQQALVQLQQQSEGGTFLLQVEELCRLHHCYAQLYALCHTLAALEQPGQPLSASPRLLNYLASLGAEEGAAPRDTFAAHVFQQLHEDGLHAELLLLPSSFHPLLKEFMKAHPQLLWLLLARAGDWAGAAAALAQTAAQCKGDLHRHQRLLCLAKLSARAAGDNSASSAASSQLQVLEVQQRLGLAQGQGSGQGALDLPTVVDAALQMAQQQGSSGSGQEARVSGPDAALLAVEALASCQLEARQANKSRWRLTWRQLLDVTDWARLDSQHQVQQPTSEAGLAGDLGALLEATPLYQGALACCGRGVFGYGASVTDSGPLQEVKGWLLEWCTGANAGTRVQTLVTTAFELALTHYQQRTQQLHSPWAGVGGSSAFDTVAAGGEDLMVM